MQVSIKQLRKLVMEAVEAELKEQGMDEYTYSRGGAGGNRHGDSWDEAEPERGYTPESPAEREERLRRDAERDAYYGERDTGWNESYVPKGKLTLEAIRRMVRSAVVAESKKRAGK